MDAARIQYLITGTLKVVGELIRHGGPSATKEQIEARLAICQTCDQIERGHCKACGCRCEGGREFFNSLAYRSKECPHPNGPKWLAIPD